MSDENTQYPNLAQLRQYVREACNDPAMVGSKFMAIEMPWADWVAIRAELNKVLKRGAK